MNDPICLCGHPASLHHTDPMLMGCDGMAIKPQYMANPKVYGDGCNWCVCLGFHTSDPNKRYKSPEAYLPKKDSVIKIIGKALKASLLARLP